MSSAALPSQQGPAAPSLFGVLWSSRTYLALLYLVIEFPLSTFSFTFLVAVLSTGLSMAWTFVGLPILFLGLVVSRSLTALECSLTERLTGREMPRVDVMATPQGGFWRRTFAVLKDGDSWLSVVFLLVRFPLATAAFVVAISLVCGAIWAIAQPVLAPLLAHVGQPEEWGIWTVDTVWEGLLFVPGGVLLLFLSLHAVNGLAWIMAESTRWMIGRVGHLRMRREVLRSLAGNRALDGATVLHELRLFNGYSVDLTPTKLYATLVGLKTAGLVQGAESGGVEWFSLTPQGEQAAAEEASRRRPPRYC
jgi:hypothetical protein